jgi:hypothetical protein
MTNDLEGVNKSIDFNFDSFKNSFHAAEAFPDQLTSFQIAIEMTGCA